jgi:hypothetical protein
MKTIHSQDDETAAEIVSGYWEPAANGTEVPTKYRSGHTLLYCYNALLGKHAFINCETDHMVTDAELDLIFKF